MSIRAELLVDFSDPLHAALSSKEMGCQPSGGEEEAQVMDMAMRSKMRVGKDAAEQDMAACSDGEDV